MSQRLHYDRAPITEAVINFETVPPSTLAPDRLVQLLPVLPPGYLPQTSKLMDAKSTTRSVEDGKIEITETVYELAGFRFEREDGAYVLQARVDGFVFSALPPYRRWEGFRDAAIAAWAAYKQFCAPEMITRIGLRYINRLDLPHRAGTSLVHLEDYLTIYPEVPDDHPVGVMSAFFAQVQSVQHDLEASLVINVALPPDTIPDHASVILDIDLFREVLWETASDKPTWEFLEQLHERKNEVFEATITEDTRRLIE
jgi:uncharacterized protein (TIGR04255 family)